MQQKVYMSQPYASPLILNKKNEESGDKYNDDSIMPPLLGEETRSGGGVVFNVKWRR